MNPEDILHSIAGATITLAGFAAVFRAFTGSHQVDGHSEIRLNSILELGIAAALLCYLPAVLQSFNWHADQSYRVLSAVGGLYYVHWLHEFWKVRNVDHQTPKSYRVAAFSACTVFTLFWVNALGLTANLRGVYLVALLIILFLQGLALSVAILGGAVKNYLTGAKI